MAGKQDDHEDGEGHVQQEQDSSLPQYQYQYSERVALPENTAYLEITDLAAVSRLYPLKADACMAFMPDVSRRGSGMSIPYPEERFI